MLSLVSWDEGDRARVMAVYVQWHGSAQRSCYREQHPYQPGKEGLLLVIRPGNQTSNSPPLLTASLRTALYNRHLGHRRHLHRDQPNRAIKTVR